MPGTRASLIILACTLTGAAARAQGNPPTQPPQQQAPATRTDSNTPPVVRRGPRPYAQVITARAHTEQGGITVHRVDDRYFFEVPDSLLGRDFLLVTRVVRRAGRQRRIPDAPAASLNERMVRWERVNERVMLQSISSDRRRRRLAADRAAWRENNYAPILGAFPIAAFAQDSNAYVIDVTDFFAGDKPATSGLSAAAAAHISACVASIRRAATSASVRAFPINVEVRQVQTFDAADAAGRPQRRHGDAGDAPVDRAAAESSRCVRATSTRASDSSPSSASTTASTNRRRRRRQFITRWRLEPKDPGGVCARRARRADQADRLLHRSRHADEVEAAT